MRLALSTTAIGRVLDARKLPDIYVTKASETKNNAAAWALFNVSVSIIRNRRRGGVLVPGASCFLSITLF